jgi:poly-beta-1,6-N-acetyl-D-glucosamine synthase
MYFIPDILFATLLITVLACAGWDWRRKRLQPDDLPALTVIVPCYNDAATVGKTLRSIFAAYPADKLDVVAVDDGSSDHSLDAIREAAESWPIRVMVNPQNVGKVESLNRGMREARHALILCLDADTMINREALNDMIARMHTTAKLGAVSCPYRPANKGFLAAMQGMEYSMLRIAQGAGNMTSALALWGGCLMVRRQAFDAVCGFSKRAITEDVELAFKLNQAGWKVEQSFVFVESYVPVSWRQWFRQKIRWTAGGFQCVMHYPAVWIRNPIQVLFISSYALLALTRIVALSSDYSMFHIVDHAADMMADGAQWKSVWHALDYYYGEILPVKILLGIGYNLISVIYILPFVSSVRDMLRVGLVIPFSMGYFPLYMLVSLCGLLFWFTALRRLPASERAW